MYSGLKFQAMARYEDDRLKRGSLGHHSIMAMDLYLDGLLLDENIDPSDIDAMTNRLNRDFRISAAKRGIRVGLRQTRTILGTDNIPPDEDPEIISAGPFTLNVPQRILTTPYREPKLVPLSEKLTSLAAILLRRADQVVSFGDLMKYVWPEGITNAGIRPRISALRLKSNDPPISPSQTRHFQSVTNLGYIFRT